VVASRTAREWPRPSDCHQIGGWHWQAAPTRSAGHARYLGHWRDDGGLIGVLPDWAGIDSGPSVAIARKLGTTR
jgi:hypothetical protein